MAFWNGRRRVRAELEARLNAIETRLAASTTILGAALASLDRIERTVSDLSNATATLEKSAVDAHQLHLRLTRFAIQLGHGPAPSALLALAPASEIVQASGLFDEAWYLQRYPDVDPEAIEPVLHYINVGAAEGRDPGPHFDGAAYLRANPDVASAGYNPLVHYLRHGIVEGRAVVTTGLDTARQRASHPARPDPALAKFHTHALGSKRAGDIDPSPERLALVVEYDFDRDAALTVGVLASRARDGLTDVEAEIRAIASLAAKMAPGEPRVSILIPVHNQVSYTLACLHSIFLNPPTLPFEVIIGDDVSTDATELLVGSSIPHVKVLRHPKALGFLRNCNRIALDAVGEFLCLLNNDTLVLPGTFDEMIATLTDRMVGLAGCRLLYADGTLQEAGGFVFALGDAANFGRNGDPLDPAYNYRRDTDYCSAACIAIPARLWRSLKGFDDRYAPAYYEDTDLAMRVREAGYRVVYQPRATVVHFEGQSHGRDEGTGIKRQQVANKTKFARRWVNELRAMGASRPDAPPVARNAKGHVLVVDAEVPRPDNDSGSVDTFEYLRALISTGYAVTFLPENLAPAQPYTADLNRIGVQTLYHPYCSGLADLLRRKGTTFDFVMLSRAAVARAAIPLVEAFAPQARIVFNTVDLHHLRLQREAALTSDPRIAAEAESMRKIELDLVARSHATIVVSKFERELLSNTVPNARIVEIPILRSPPATSIPPFASRKGMLFVGGFRHRPNVDGVMWFVREVWPLLRARGFDAPFSIVGSNMPEDFHHLKNLGIAALGYVEDLGPLMDASRLTVAPLRYGAGLKGKVITSISYGVPVVGTRMAMEGSDLRDREDVIIADGPVEIADAIMSVHGDEALWNHLSRTSRETFLSRFSTAAVSSQLTGLLEDLDQRGRSRAAAE